MGAHGKVVQECTVCKDCQFSFELCPSPALKQPGLLLQQRAGSLETRCWAICLATRQRPWLMFAGDANWRNVYTHLQHRLKKAHIERKWISRKRGDWKIHDADSIYSVPGSDRQVRLSMRFVDLAELPLASLSQRWCTLRQCVGIKCDVADQPPVFREPRWDRPHSLVFAHGLSNLPVEANSSDREFEVLPADHKGTVDTYCLAYSQQARTLDDYDKFRHTPRHEYIAEQLQNFKSEVDHVLWSTNVRLRSHPHVTRDRACQMRAAESATIKVLDLKKYTEENGEVVHMASDQFDERVMDYILTDIFANIGCTECGGV